MKTFASVFFKHTTNGWRVSYIRPCKVDRHTNGLAHTSLFENEVVITGYLPNGLREGQFCKRPHKVIQVKEFRK